MPLSADDENLLSVENISRDYNNQCGIFRAPNIVHALKNVSFTLKRGKTLAIVGESGCGKTTLARILTLLDAQTSGVLWFNQQKINIAKEPISPELRRKVQLVFRNPFASLNPQQRIGTLLAEPLLLNTTMSPSERRQAVENMMRKVDIPLKAINDYPDMFSAGQRQRIAIARAIMLRPDLLVLDEPVSALDLSVQAEVLNLLADLQDEFNLTYVFVSHDLSVVRHIADEVLVMCFGEVAEYGSCEDVFNHPQHNYTKRLFEAQPHGDIASIKRRIFAKQKKQVRQNPPPANPISNKPSS